ncbi:MAG: DUF2469 family protein [Actinobacteria bacterium]|nr:MAG: DUF2469 family protein [Actinomycetota bacterium]
MDSIDELDLYEAERRLALFSEYREISRTFHYYVETELRAYLADEVEVEPMNTGGSPFFKVTLKGVWVYEAERPNREIPEAVIWSVGDVHVQKLKTGE